MKNVKTILMFIIVSACMFASSQRVAALGGNVGFWPDDDQTYTLFPQAINNLDMVQVNGAGNGTGEVGVVWGEGTTWGFLYDGAGDDDCGEGECNDWVNLAWGNGDMGLLFGLGRSSYDSGEPGADASSTMDISVDWGQNMDFGELGVSFGTSSADDGDGNDDNDPSWMGLSANVRRPQSMWLFSDMLVGFGYSSTTIGDATTSGMSLGVDCYTSLPMSDGVRGILAMGFGYNSRTVDTGVTGVDAVTSSTINLPNTTIAVEADVTDWATVRFGMNNSYTLSGSSNGDNSYSGSMNSDGTSSSFGWNFGLGFNYGSFTLDMVINENIFNNPMHFVTGRNTTPLSTTGASLTYSF